MRLPPCLLVGLLAGLLVHAAPAGAGRLTEADLVDRYRADELGPVPPDARWEIDPLLPPEARSWPESAREALRQRVRSEWPGGASLPYGTLHAGLGVWLSYPLVTARLGDRLVIPVVHGTRLPIEGALALPDPGKPRRVVLLLDASSSANARTRFAMPEGGVESVSVLEAETRALRHLIELLEDDWLDFGLIAFGEGTWPIVPPGSSARAMREQLERFRREHPGGEGRTDLLCALSLAQEWLDSTPRGVAREIYVLTDGDLPYSGRFIDCGFAGRHGGRKARARCEARRNRTVCPASKRLRFTRGRSDVVALSGFARRVRRKLTVVPLVFEPDRAARAYEEIAATTGGEVVRVSSAQAIDAVLPALVAGRLRGVHARNLRTGQETGDLLVPGEMRFEGELALLPGANDVELRVESDRGPAARFRFRIHAAPGFLAGFLEDLRRGNRDLEMRAAELLEEARRTCAGAPARSLDIRVDSSSAAPAAPARE